MGTTRLQLYNDALLLCKERAIASLTVEEEPRRLLDQVWNNGGVNRCLEEAQWEFAMRTLRIDYDPSVTPDFGYQRAFEKPSDWILTSALCSDEYFRVPVTGYVDESGYWYSDLDTLYVRMISNDAVYGGDLSKWPQSFCDFVAAHFASKIVAKLTSDEKLLIMFINPERPQHSIRGQALLHAKSRCAMSGPTTFPAQGNWTAARNRGITRRDGGRTGGSLIG